MQRINSAWTQGLQGPEKASIEALVKENTILLDRLSKILYNMQVRREQSVLGDYDTPSWSHKQAHLNGEAAVIKKLLDILEVSERDDHPKV